MRAPWTAEFPAVTRDEVRDADGMLVAVVFGPDDSSDSAAETHRITRLIAAAPEMLQAIGEALRLLGQGPGDPYLKHNDYPCASCLVGPDPIELQELVDGLLSAAAKAEGGAR